MESSCKWKKLLVEWIKCTQCIAKAYDCLEQIDLEEFFHEYKTKFTNPLKHGDLFEFLKENYPQFEYHFDDSNQLSSVDYIFVYSLFLHFSCVKNPDQYYHNICNNLQATEQQEIASFFNYLLKNDEFDREGLRSAIANSSKKLSTSSLSPPMLNTSFVDSPMRPPKLKFSPATPRTTLLEEKCREVIQLRAQLEAERYDKGVLEMMYKESETKIEKMILAQRKNVEELHEIKNEYLANCAENISPNRNIKQEQVKIRLRKQIAQKEETIFKLQEDIERLTDMKESMATKLSYTEKQMYNWMEKTQKLEQMVDDIKTDLESKTEYINFLKETNAELQNFIRETRSNNRLEAMDSSSDFLDSSFIRTANNSDPVPYTPENLARSVVDIQLQEKDAENRALKETINNLRTESDEFSTTIRQLMSTHSKYLNYTPDTQSKDGTLSPSTDRFIQIFFTSFENFVVNYENLQKSKDSVQMEKMQIATEKATIEANVRNLELKITGLVKNNDELEASFEKMKLRTRQLENENKTIQENFTSLDEKYNRLTMESTATENSLNEKIVQLEKIIVELRSENEHFSAEMAKLQTDVEQKSKSINELTSLKESYENDLQLLRTNVDNLRRDCSDHIGKIEELTTLEIAIQSEKSEIQLQVTGLNAIVTELKTLCDSRVREIETINSELDVVKSERDELNSIVNQLRAEINELVDKCQAKDGHADELFNQIKQLTEKMTSINEIVHQID